MSSRQRVMDAVNHREPDRIPVDLGGHRSSGIMAIAYRRLLAHLGRHDASVRVYDIMQQLAVIDDSMLNRLGVDTIEMGRGFALHDDSWRPWVLPDGSPCSVPAFIHPVREGDDWRIYHQDGTPIALQKGGSLYFEQTCFPLAGSQAADWPDLERQLEYVSWAALGTPPAPLGYDVAGLAAIEAGAKALRASTDRAILFLFGGNLLELGQMLFRNDNFFMLLAGEPLRAHRLLDRLLELHLSNLKKVLPVVSPHVDIILFGDDLGMQTGPQISPRMYKTFFQPREKIMWDAVHARTDLKIMLHSCGGIYPLLPGLIDAGLDIIQPVQTTCTDMDADKLKREFGHDLCLWGGGCNTRDVLAQGTPQQVRDDVRRRMDVLAPGGGYVFQQIHNIMSDVPPQNIVAMLEAVNE